MLHRVIKNDVELFGIDSISKKLEISVMIIKL